MINIISDILINHILLMYELEHDNTSYINLTKMDNYVKKHLQLNDVFFKNMSTMDIHKHLFCTKLKNNRDDNNYFQSKDIDDYFKLNKYVEINPFQLYRFKINNYHPKTSYENDNIDSLLNCFIICPANHTGGLLTIKDKNDKLILNYETSEIKKITMIVFSSSYNYEISPIDNGTLYLFKTILFKDENMIEEEDEQEEYDSDYDEDDYYY